MFFITKDFLFCHSNLNANLCVLLSSDNFLEIDIYYGQLKSEQVEQKEAYDVISFFSKSRCCFK